MVVVVVVVVVVIELDLDEAWDGILISMLAAKMELEALPGYIKQPGRVQST